MIRATVVLIALVVVPVSSQEIYDVLLKGGHVIDPKNGRNQRMDIAISAKKIQKIAPVIPSAAARNVVDLSDYYVTPGLIDVHAYVAPLSTPAGVTADHNTLRYGVTTVVDAGSAGSQNFDAFKKDVIDDAKVRVLAFLNIAAGGLLAPGADSFDTASAAKVTAKYHKLIVGIRAPRDKPAALSAALQAAQDTNTIVMADSADLRPGDIDTQIYGLHARRLVDTHHRVQDVVLAPGKKGVFLDVGHGDDGFWFRIAVPAIKQGFLPDTISTGMDSRSVMLPRANMANVLSKFLAMGMTLEQVIERTTVNPAKALKRPDLGSLQEGGTADIAVFELRKGSFGLVDSGHARMTADRELRCVLTMRDGEVVWDTEGLSLTDWKKAGPYSNFK